MKNRILWALVGLNVLLAVTLALRISNENTAMAQARRPADYILIPGEVSGGSSAVVYMIDTTNSLLGAMVYDDSSKVMNTMPPIDLTRVFQTGPEVPGGAGPGRTPPGAGHGGAGGAGGAGGR